MKRTAKSLAAFFALIQLVFFAGPVLGQERADTYGNNRTVVTESWVEEWDAATGRWVVVAGENAAPVSAPQPRSAVRYAQPVAPRGASAMLAQYGPFVVTSDVSAAMMGSTDSSSLAHFEAMLRDFPQLATLELVEAPGTSNDIANLAVGRRIREAGIATHVPSGGSVRSGAVELFLAGATRTMEPGAQFAVHSWLDNHGREADDFAADHPANRLYLDYYVEMGMSEARARDFYAMTNSVPHSSALWLDAGDMRPWLQPERTPSYRAPAVQAAVRVNAGPITLERLTEEKMPSWTLPSVNFDAPPALIPAQIDPALDYVDLSAITLAQLDQTIIG